MFFEIENTPENGKKKGASTSGEELSVLTLVPFSPQPTIIFHGIPVGERVSRILYISNPKSQAVQVSVQKRSDTINIELSWCENLILPHQTIPLELSWQPNKVTAGRTVIHVSDKTKGKYDVSILYKTKDKDAIKRNGRKIAGNKLKKSPLKQPKQKSPKAMATAFLNKENRNDISKTVRGTFENDIMIFHKSPLFPPKTQDNGISMYSFSEFTENCDVRRETYLIKNNGNGKGNKENFLYQTTPNMKRNESLFKSPHKNNNGNGLLSAIENLEFTPLKSHNKNSNFLNKNDYPPNNKVMENKMASKNEYIPTINLIDTYNSFSSDVIEIKETDYEVYSMQDVYRFNHLKLPSPHYLLNDSHSENNENLFKTPYTKNVNISNDSICTFDPKRCSTEKKVDHQFINTYDFTLNNSNTRGDATINISNKRLSSETYTKGDSPIVPLDPENNEHLHSSPYARNISPRNLLADYALKNPNAVTDVNTVNYNERANLRNTFKEKNNCTNARDIIEANLWQTSPPRRMSPTPLSSIPEEQSEIYSETTFTLKKKSYSETFVLNQTFEKNKCTYKPPAKVGWSKTTNREIKQTDHLKNETTIDSLIFAKPRETPIGMTKKTYEVDVYSMASVVDPFMASTCLYDEEAFHKLEIEFMRWLNYLLTPPLELDTKLEVDIGKAWIENRSKLVPAAPTKEQISLGYTSHRLESLRKSATALITSTQMSQVFIKVSNQVERKILSIRADKNLHLDIGLQKIISGLLLCYNPLWLRIGLEAVYRKVITLSSNNDICGLSEFIIENMFKDPYINSKYAILQPSYAENIKKFTLKKFLFLVYFLDQAKEKKLIFHDPCLFCRNATYKESKQILFQFTKELLSGVGDITKHLKPLGYEVTHKQKYIHEFKYAVHNLAIDLKDGVRLTRLMEIILMRDGLLQHMRTPAISRLQKIHNVQIALSELTSANFVILGDITPKDIADGHREKTLSLLWQLINKFQAPLFSKAAISIQRWWRRRYLKVVLKNRIERKRRALLNLKAVKIQSWWRGILCRRSVQTKIEAETKASIVIQKWWRKTQCQRSFETIKCATICIQTYYRNYLLVRRAKFELKSLRENKAALKIQNWYKKHKSIERFNLANEDRRLFLLQKISIIKIQRWYTRIQSRSLFKYTDKDFISYMQYKSSALVIQRWFRKIKVYQQLKLQNKDRPFFLAQKNSAIKIQNWYRKIKMLRYFELNNMDRDLFLCQRSSAIKIQTWYRKIKLQHFMESQNLDRPFYLQCKSSAIKIQKWYKKIKENKHFQLHNEDRRLYVSRRASTITIQRWYRKQMIYRELKRNNKDHPRFLLQKTSAIKIQQWYRKKMVYILLKSQNVDRPQFLLKKSSTITIQRWYRKVKIQQQLKQQNEDRPNFLLQKSSSILIQRWYRKIKLQQMLQSQNVERPLFLHKKCCIVKIQTWYRQVKLRQYLKSINTERPQFLIKRSSAIKIQQWYRRMKLNVFMKLQNKDRPLFLLQRSSAIEIQRWYRKRMIIRELKKNNMDRPLYLLQKSSAVKLQCWYRKVMLRKYLKLHNKDRPQFLAFKSSALKIQIWYRKTKLNEKLKLENTDRPLFLLKKSSAIKIQIWYREIKLRQYLASQNTDRHSFILKKTSAVKIQIWYRKCKRIQHNTDRAKFLQLKSSTIEIQRWYRRIKLNFYLKSQNNDRPKFLLQKSSAIKIQSWYRITKEHRELEISNTDRPLFLKMKSSTVVIQKWYRTIQLLRNNEERKLYLQFRSAAIKIQRLHRANIKMVKERQTYINLRRSAIIIQQFYKSYIETKRNRIEYLKLVRTTLFIQRTYRAKLQMKIARNKYLQLKSATIAIQKIFRGYLQMKAEREYFVILKTSSICIQQYYRCYMIMKKEREEFLIKYRAILLIQNYYRKYCIVKQFRTNYLLKKSAAICIQRKWRSILLMRIERNHYLMLRTACICIQKAFRDRQLRQKQIDQENILYTAAIKIQSYWRGYNLRKKQTEGCRIKQLRDRWRNGALLTTQDTLAERNDDAFDVISRFRDIASIVRAFKSLDFISDVYPMMYGAEQVNRICKSLIIYMDSTNRSVSSLETLRLGVSILANLARYKHTAPHACHITFVDTILTLMMRWCEKDDLLFCSLCTLLWLYAKYDQFKPEIMLHLMKNKMYKTLCKVRCSIIRKKKMDMHKKINQSLNSSFIPSTPVKNNKMKLIKYPMTEPDYGISNSTKPRYFQDSTDAIDTVFAMYNLPISMIQH